MRQILLSFKVGDIIGELQIYFSDSPITININIHHLLYEIARAPNIANLLEAIDYLSKKDNEYLTPKKLIKEVGGGGGASGKDSFDIFYQTKI